MIQDSKKIKAVSPQTSPEDVLQIYGLNSVYRASDGSFDIQKAKEDYSMFLTSVPRKYRILLEQSFTSVEYEQAALESAPFGYSHSKDAVLYNPTRSDFWSLDFTTANTHELTHRIDSFLSDQ